MRAMTKRCYSDGGILEARWPTIDRRSVMVHHLARFCAWTGLVLLVVLGLLPVTARGQEVTPTAPGGTPTAAPAGTILRIDQGSAEFDADFPLDPQKTFAPPQVAVSGLDYEGLTRIDADLTTAPAAAESWETSADGTLLTFHLRDSLTYSDGSPLTAERFRYAVERTCDPLTEADYASILFDIVGCEAFFTSLEPAATTATPGATLGAAGTPETTAAYEAAKAKLGVRALDDRTLEIQLEQPAAYVPTIASTWVFYPVQQEAVERDPDGWWADPSTRVGNGPFRVIDMDAEEPDRRIRFARNDRYWGGRAQLDGIEYVYFPEGDNQAGLDA
jgi:oligopeptide transport system substrate-binding protein